MNNMKWNLVSEVGLPEPDREIIFTYTLGNHKMVDKGAYYPEPIDETFEYNKAGFFEGQLSNPEARYKAWFMYICAPEDVIAWYYLEPYNGEA